MMNEKHFDPQSKVWVYQSDRPFTQKEIDWLNTELQLFVNSWTAHNQQLKGIGRVVEDRFVLLMVDETQTTASGCSIDSSVKFIKAIGRELQVDFFNRFLFSFKTANGIITHSVSDVASLLRDGHLNDQTEVYNCLVFTKAEFDNGFKTAFANSWMQQFV